MKAANRSGTHTALVSAVADLVVSPWQSEREVRVGHRSGQPPSRCNYVSFRQIDLLIRNGDYRISFEIKSSWRALEADNCPSKHAASARNADEFYFVLPSDQIQDPNGMPIDAGVIGITRDGQIEIVKYSPLTLRIVWIQFPPPAQEAERVFLGSGPPRILEAVHGAMVYRRQHLEDLL